ncbi:hypothetical protein REC12_19910 [Desulfosporosinus sp. PR]|uniref:hypothetical protein n=1 Tax=Candidatus Desulfosporosinus nitrosoreducens TaxID=3401928 RepID=UPI0027E5F1EE|nr:hypothetical protein [Desulfosporosinus sp. PR]MDQ7095863.1 hypothetical protein [Desulfosporosinus sp. PR]
MDIKIGVGLDNLIFGMSQEEVKECLGKPNKISEKQKDDGIVYHYNDIQFKVKFDQKENSKLYSIEVYNPEVTLFNQKIIGKNKWKSKLF